MFPETNQNWQEELQRQASELVARRFGTLTAEIQRLQASVNEACERLAAQGQHQISAEEASGLRQHIERTLSAATSEAATQAQNNFQAQMGQAVEQARQETGARIRQEYEIQLQELREQLAESRQAVYQAETVSDVPVAALAAEAGSSQVDDYRLLKEAIAELDAQRTQADVLSTLVRHAAQLAPRTVFFVVKGNSAIGWKTGGFTNGLTDETARSLIVPVQANTVLRDALDRHQTATAQPGQQENAQVLGQYGPLSSGPAVAIPLVIRGKSAAVLYADDGAGNGRSVNTEAIETLMRVTGMAIELLPARKTVEVPGPTPSPATVAAPPPAAPARPVAPPPAAPAVTDVQPVTPVATETGAYQTATAPPASETTEPVPPLPPPPVESQPLPPPPPVQPAPPAGSHSNEEEVRAHNDARRFARLLVSEIKLYNEAKVAEGRRSHDLYERLKDDIDRSRQMYEKRVSSSVAAKFDYFYDELVHTLGEGDASKLGRGCPGPTVPV